MTACASPPRRCRRASPRRRPLDTPAAHPGSSPLPRGSSTRRPLARFSLSQRMVWLMIRSRSRPPPRGPLRISGETRAATPSKYAQAARNSVIARSNSASVIGPCSVEEAANEMPQKSVEPGPTLSSTISSDPAASNSGNMPARSAIGRYRSRYDSSVSRATSGVFAPRLHPSHSRLKATARFPLGPRSMTVRTGMA